MVMEASPSPQSVGREFVRQYYTLLNKAPAHLHRFYNNYSSFVHGGLDAGGRDALPVVGQKQIHNRIQQLNFRDCHAKISQVDAQATLGNGVVVQVSGELSNGGAPMRRFTQTFVLAAQSPKKYYVHNDIFRYQDIVFSDESGSASGRSEGEEEEVSSVATSVATGVTSGGGYYATGGAAFPPPPAPPTLEQHLNGHLHLDESSRHLVQALQGTTVSGPTEPVVVAMPVSPVAIASEPELGPEMPEPQSEPEREPTPPPQQALPSAPSEPKTYANLLKSGFMRAGAPAPAPSAPISLPLAPPTTSPVAPSAPPSAPGSAPLDQRPRPARPPRDQPPADGPTRQRYSDSQQLFLGNIPHSATEEELKPLFARFGPVAELRVHKMGHPSNPGQPRHPNYGFITYETEQAAIDCLNHGALYFPADSSDGVKLNVEEKKARVGGGGGGGGAGGAGGGDRRRPPSGHRGTFPRNNYRR